MEPPSPAAGAGTEAEPPPWQPDRRTFVTGVGVVGLGCLAGAGLSGCGGGEADEEFTPFDLKAADVPEGEGVVDTQHITVVTQPKSGVFKAFSAICTHQGCTVTHVADGTIDCPCHGSKFAVADGSVVQGPAPRPLPARTVTRNGDTLHIS